MSSSALSIQQFVALNAARAAEEKRGIIHWLRPEYQNPSGTRSASPQLGLTPREQKKAETRAAKAGKIPWPKPLSERVQVVEKALHAAGRAVSPEDLAKNFARAKPSDVAEILQTLVTLGRARNHGKQFSR